MARGSPWRQSQTNHVRVLDEGRVRRVLIPRSGIGLAGPSHCGPQSREEHHDIPMWQEPCCAVWTGKEGGREMSQGRSPKAVRSWEHSSIA